MARRNARLLKADRKSHKGAGLPQGIQSFTHDLAELDRVFPVQTSSETKEVARNGAHPLQSNSAQSGEIAALQQLLADREATIADLRARLDFGIGRAPSEHCARIFFRCPRSVLISG